MENQQQQPSIKRSVRQTLTWAQILSTLARVWLTKPGSVGHRYFGGQAFIAWCILFVVAAFSYSPDLMKFWVATGGWFLLHKLAYYIEQRKGKPRPHSQFIGISLLSFMGGNTAAYRLWEPLLTFIVGFVLIDYGKGYGGFAVIIAISLFISSSYTTAAERAQINAIQDARYEQQILAEATREN
jgi:hypothetical protein